MAIPEPEFSITVFQLEKIIEELDYEIKKKPLNRAEYILILRNKCFEHLDTI